MKALERLFGARAGARREADAADRSVERIVRATDRRLALVRGYRERLRAPVAVASRDLREAIRAIPGPAEVSPQSWVRDETVRALFATGSDAVTAACGDAGVGDFFALRPAGDCFGLLALRVVERRVLAPSLEGEIVQAEVARTTVSFSEPAILAPGPTETALREELLQRALEYLALRALARVAEVSARKRELEQERALLQAQLQVARRRGAGLGALDEPPAAPAGIAALTRDLEHTTRELEKAASRELLPALLDELHAVLGHPREHLTFSHCALTLDAMNFAVAPSPRAITPRVSILGLAGRGSFAVLVARFPRAAHRRDERLTDAAKYL